MFDENEKPELNITPLVDVMLVLLAILMVAMPAIIYNENILLPDGSKVEVSTSPDFVISIDRDKNIYMNNHKMSFDEFADNLVLSQVDKGSVAYIKADKNLMYDDVMFVMKTLKKLGYLKISLQTL
ncbi:MAG: biopolymer transporter ExbD [Campylobacter sp.]|nr:biopolymer transporter ExbD [Campylobacter sp.]